ncbi:2-dehydropantoate 2-reductase [Dongia sedimenti]|uniref:2-dehydropantoate 2-reductase n=1 Tax=Dongia sedimenti TaxID=3064282 RepID=A0ABU0YVR7_9PROT|nr:2-dehydropantoate 2-reductase [Rhodospirillaceae bacterium R-7]
MESPPKVCIYGAGAIGGMIGIRLALAGAEVGVVARGQTLKIIQAHGLRLIEGDATVFASVRAVAEPAALGPQDYVIVTVKAPALREIAARIKPLIGPATTVVTAMNGIPWWFFQNHDGPLAGRSLTAVDPDGSIARNILSAQTIGCVIYMSAAVERPGVIRHDFGNRLLIGENDNRVTPRLQRLGAWLRRAGFDGVETTDIRREIWLKLWGNLSTNPISLLTEATLDRIVGDPLVETLVRRMMEEAAAIGAAIGVHPSLTVDEMIAKAHSFGAIKTSMLQDLERGTPVEIDALLTVTHDIGAMVNVPTPFIDSVLGLARLRAAEHGLMDRVA